MDQAGPMRQLSIVRAHLRENGLRWTAYQLLIVAAERWIEFVKRRMRALELARGLTGLHTKEANREGWNTYDWSEQGEEWTAGPEWRQALIDDVLLANMPDDPTSLEIGPGAGRWTEALLGASRRLVLTDIAEEPIRLCRERFAGRDDIEYHVTDGAGLGPVATGSIDYVWSFDVFVHIAPVDQSGYLRELARVMRPRARAVIHHAGRGATDGGWRASMTSERFGAMLADNGLVLTRQFHSWGPDSRFEVPIPGDVITVFEKPAPVPA